MGGYGFDSRRRLPVVTSRKPLMVGDLGAAQHYRMPCLIISWDHPDLELATVSNDILGGYPSGQRGLTVNQLAEAFGGSNPSPPTTAYG